MLVLYTKQTQGGAVWCRICLVKRLTEKKKVSFFRLPEIYINIEIQRSCKQLIVIYEIINISLIHPYR